MLLAFFLVFEVILNAIAEVTRFADRRFYADWWNSTGFDEFSRKWNQARAEGRGRGGRVGGHLSA